jgi:hypothetical protein
MYPEIKKYCEERCNEFEMIGSHRREILVNIASYIRRKLAENDPVNLVYICTHNSRRSHFGQVWSKVASVYYGFSNVNTFSGGTEATAFNPNAINALRTAGFQVSQTSESDNPLYLVAYDEALPPIECFSKVFDAPENPSASFAAIMTCGDAEENCPYIPGAEIRIATTYEDPKAFDNTPLQEQKYDERSRQIARECLYMFSLLKS